MKKLILTMFAVLLGVTFICAQSCKDSPVQTEYKTEDSDCGFKKRTCCYDGNWSGWDEACPEPSCGEEQCWNDVDKECIDRKYLVSSVAGSTVWGDKRGLSSGSVCYSNRNGQNIYCIDAGEWLGTYQYLPKGDEWKGYNGFESKEECEDYVAKIKKQFEANGFENREQGYTYADDFCDEKSDIGRKAFGSIYCQGKIHIHPVIDGKQEPSNITWDYVFGIMECENVELMDRC